MARSRRPPAKKPRRQVSIKRPAKDGTARGRRPILADHPEVKEQILAAVSAGDSLKNAALAAGVSIETLMLWNLKGREDVKAGRESIYTEFLQEITRAKAKGRVNLIALVQKGARDITHEERTVEPDGSVRTKTRLMRGDWKAASWLLAVKYRAEFGKVERYEVTGADGGPLDVRVEVPEIEPVDAMEIWTIDEPDLHGSNGSNGSGSNGTG